MNISISIFVLYFIFVPLIVFFANRKFGKIIILKSEKNTFFKRNLTMLFINMVYIPIWFSIFIWVQIEHLKVGPNSNFNEYYLIIFFALINLGLIFNAFYRILNEKDIILDYEKKQIFIGDFLINVDKNLNVILLEKVTLRRRNDFFIMAIYNKRKITLLKDLNEKETNLIFHLTNDFILKIQESYN